MKLPIGIIIVSGLLIDCSYPACLPDESLDIILNDSQNRNLLDYSTPDHYIKEDIKTYTYSDKVKKLYLDINNSNWRPVLFPETPANSLRIIIASKTMLLELSPTVTDTIRVAQTGGCPLVIDKAWYNGVLVFDRVSKFQNPVVIVK